MYHYDGDEPRQTTHCTRETSIPSQRVLKEMPEERLYFSPHSMPQRLRSRLRIKCPSLNVSPLPCCLQEKPCSSLLGLWSILQRDQRHHILPVVGLHHWSYSATDRSDMHFSSVPSSKSKAKHQTESQTRSLSLSLSSLVRPLGHCASSHPPRLGIVRRRIVPQ